MTNLVAGDVTLYQTIMGADFKASEEEDSDKTALKATFKTVKE